MAETFGVEGRGAFFEATGAIRDVVQNHLLQVLAQTAMEPPWSATDPDALRDEKVKLFRSVVPFDPAQTVRGQFRGYRDEPGVAPDSAVETYAAVRFAVDNWRWRGVPFFVRAGKRLPLTLTQVRVQLKPAPLTRLAGAANDVRFDLGPGHISIDIGARVKAFGGRPGTAPVDLSVMREDVGDDEIPGYARLLTGAMRGDPTLFVRADAVAAAWAIVQPILGDAAPVYPYEAGSWGPAEADRLAADVGGWTNPVPRSG